MLFRSMEEGKGIGFFLQKQPDLPMHVELKWQVGNQLQRTLKADWEDYSGDYLFDLDLNEMKALIRDMKRGGELTITTGGSPVWRYDLTHLNKPLDAFLGCRDL